MLKYFKTYGIIGFFRLILDKLITLLFFKNVRIIRRPFYIRGKKYISFGDNFTSGVNLRIDAFPIHNEKVIIKFGKNIQVNDFVHIAAINSIVIGDNVLIASKVFITDHNHGNYGLGEHDSPLVPPNERPLFSKPIRIEKNVWLGEFVSILPGVTIGEGSIIGTMSVVTKNIPPYSIAVGNPAIVIKYFDFPTKSWKKINH